MKLPIHTLMQWIAVLVLWLALSTPILRAADGTWTNPAGGAWNLDTNWLSNTIADGNTSTAFFDAIDLVSDTAVTLGANRTIRNLTFGNLTPSNNYSWTVSGANTLTLAGTTPTITVNPLGTGMVTISSIVAGTAGLTKSGVGTLVLSGANTLTGGLTISQGILRTTSANGFGATNGAVTVSSGATWQLGSNTANIGAFTGAGTVEATGAFTLNFGGGGASSTFAGVMQNGAGTLALNKVGNGTLTLSGANTYTGGTTVTAGTLTLSGANRLASSGAVSVVGGTLNLGGVGQTVGAVATTGGTITNGTLTGTSYTFNGATVSASLAGSGVALTSTGTVILTGANTYTGGTTLNANHLQIGNDSGLGTGALTIAGSSILSSDSTAARTLANAIVFNADPTLGHVTNNGVLTLNGAGTLTGTRTFTVNSEIVYAGAISGTGFGIIKAGGSALTLSGANTYTGTTTLFAGTLRGGNNAAFGTGTLALNTGTLSSDSTTARTFANAVTFGGNVTLGDAINNGLLTLNGAGTLSGGDRILTTASNVVYAGAISGATRMLTKAGSATLTLSGANTHTGGTSLSAGTLQAGNNAAFGTGALTLSAGTLSSDSTTARIFANAVNFGGDVTLGDGTNNGLLTFNGAGTLTGHRTLTLASAVTFANAMGGGFGLTKAGTGTLTFSAVNTYTGTTTVSAGTLVLSGSGSIASSSLVDVQSGATLSTSGVTFGTGQTVMGRGTIVGNTVIQGTLAPGSSPGILSFSNNLTLAGGANSVFEIQNTGLVRGTDYDGVNVTSLLTSNGTLTLSLASLVPGGGTYDLFSFGSVTGNFTSVVFSGGIYTGTFTENSGIWSATDTNGSGQTFSFNQASGDLIISAIPEPSAAGLFAGGLMTLLWRRRR